MFTIQENNLIFTVSPPTLLLLLFIFLGCLWLLEYFFYIHVPECLCLHACDCTWQCSEEQRRKLDPLEMESEITVSCCVVQTWMSSL